MSNIKNEISITTGILSVIVCLIIGLVGNLRITTILFRALVCFAITFTLCLFVVTAVVSFARGHQPVLQRQNVDKLNNSSQEDEATSKTL